MDQAAIDDVRSELHDRYGAPPESVLNLLAAGELRLKCEQLGIAQLDRKRTQIEVPNPANKKQPIKQFVEMLHLRFAVPDNTTPADLAHSQIDPGQLMKLVSRNTKRGAQFTPQGILRWPLTNAKAEDVLAGRLRAMLDSPRTHCVAPQIRVPHLREAKVGIVCGCKRPLSHAYLSLRRP